MRRRVDLTTLLPAPQNIRSSSFGAGNAGLQCCLPEHAFGFEDLSDATSRNVPARPDAARHWVDYAVLRKQVTFS